MYKPINDVAMQALGSYKVAYDKRDGGKEYDNGSKK
jgi:hypothetical protein